MEHDARDRRIGRIAWVMAWVALVLGQFHAMARHNTVDGSEDLQTWTTRVWSDPARKVFAPLLDWANPDAVYLTYGKIWFPVFLAFTACAFVVRRRRQPVTGFEKWAWRFALARLLLGDARRLRQLLDPVDPHDRRPGPGLPVPRHPGPAADPARIHRPRDRPAPSRDASAGHGLAARPDDPDRRRHLDVHLDGQRRPPCGLRLRDRRPGSGADPVAGQERVSSARGERFPRLRTQTGSSHRLQPV